MAKRKITTVLIVTAAALIIAISAILAWNHFFDYSYVLEINWGISIPQESHYSEIYSQDSGSGFHGDGNRYHIFICRDIEPISEMFEWQPAEHETIFHDSYSDAAEEWLDEINVPLQERPDYENCLYWYQSQNDNSEIIILLDKDVSKMYVIESFL